MRFEPYLMTGWYENEKNILVVEEGASITCLKLELAKDASKTLGSAFFMGSSNLWILVREWSPTTVRPLTILTLQKVTSLLKQVESKKESILTGDFRGILPDGSMVVADKDTITVKDGIQRGIYLVGGVVNPGELGYVTVRAYRVRDGARLSEESMTRNSLEYVGFSTDPTIRFLYESEIQIDEGDSSMEFAAQFELWFHPDQGEERKLAETTSKIYEWQR